MPSTIVWRRPLRPRDVHQNHRASTPLELFVDLAFVVGVAQVAASQHHALIERHFASSILAYASVFFAIWWAWMNFTWFASAYDNDDVPYRLATLVQIAGVLVIAAGVPRAFSGNDFAVVTIGYLICRLGLISQWLRVDGDAGQRRAARHYAAGLAICQVGWLTLLLLPSSARSIGFFVLVAAELAVPGLAERHATTSWHPGHIAERYGSFTLIVLGESMIAPTIAVQAGLDQGISITTLVLVGAGGLLIVVGMWWLYFDHDAEAMFHRAIGDDDTTATARRLAFTWGYGHFVVFGSAAAVGAGLAVTVDHTVESESAHPALGDVGAALSLAIPIAVFLLSMWVLHGKAARWREPAGWVLPLAGVAVIAESWLPQPVLLAGLTLAALLTIGIVTGWTPAVDVAEQ